MNEIATWIQANPWTTFAIVVYVIANLAPRPDVSKLTGWRKSFWQIVDRLSILSADKVPGRLKMVLLDSPVAPADADDDNDVDDDESDDDEDEEPVVVDDDSEDEPGSDEEPPEVEDEEQAEDDSAEKGSEKEDG